jgi:hypothetical protein
METLMWLTLLVRAALADAPHEDVRAELYLFDGTGALLQTAEGAALCDPCALELSSYATRGAWSLEVLAAASGGTAPANPAGVQALLLTDSPDVWPALEPVRGGSTPFDASLRWEVSAIPSGRAYGPGSPFAPAATAITAVDGASALNIVLVRAY